MSENDNGRYCNSCNKSVIDFSLMTDEQLATFFKKGKGEICGRIHPDQLNKTLSLPVRRIPWLIYFLKISIPAFLFSFKAGAQDTLFKYTFNVLQQPDKVLKQKLTDTAFYLTGSVQDINGGPISFASVMVPGTNRGVAANSEGKFSIKILPGDTIIECSSVGFNTGKYVIPLADKILDIRLRETNTREQIMTVGAMVVVRSHSIKNKRRQESRKEKEAINTISVYPNPTAISSTITIRWKEPVTASQEVTLYNMGGARVQQEVIVVNKSMNEAKLALKIDVPGTYVLRVRDVGNKKGQVVQLLIQP